MQKKLNNYNGIKFAQHENTSIFYLVLATKSNQKNQDLHKKRVYQYQSYDLINTLTIID